MRMPEPERREQGENIIPLINIVFLLLIFFMLAGTLASPDPIEVNPPEARSGLAADEPREGLLLLSADGNLVFEGEETSLDALPERVRMRLAQDEMLALTLKADAAARTSQLLDAMDALRDAGVDQLTLLTVPRD